MVGGILLGEVPELADGHDLGSCAARRRGSSPRFPTKAKGQKLMPILMPIDANFDAGRWSLLFFPGENQVHLRRGISHQRWQDVGVYVRGG